MRCIPDKEGTKRHGNCFSPTRLIAAHIIQRERSTSSPTCSTKSEANLPRWKSTGPFTRRLAIAFARSGWRIKSPSLMGPPLAPRKIFRLSESCKSAFSTDFKSVSNAAIPACQAWPCARQRRLSRATAWCHNGNARQTCQLHSQERHWAGLPYQEHAMVVRLKIAGPLFLGELVLEPWSENQTCPAAAKARRRRHRHRQGEIHRRCGIDGIAPRGEDFPRLQNCPRLISGDAAEKAFDITFSAQLHIIRGTRSQCDA